MNVDTLELSLRYRILRVAYNGLAKLSVSAAASVGTHLFTRPRSVPVKYLEDLPAGVQHIGIYHNLGRLEGYRWGSSAQPGVLLVHGWESHTGRLLPLARALISAGYRVVAFDGPGHGLSPRHKTNVRDFGDAVERAIEQAEPIPSKAFRFVGALATLLKLADAKHLQPQKLVALAPMIDIDQHLNLFNGLLNTSPEVDRVLRSMIQSRVGRPLAQCSAIAAARSIPVSSLIIHDRWDKIIPFDSGLQLASAWEEAIFLATEKLLSPHVAEAIVAFLGERESSIVQLDAAPRALAVPRPLPGRLGFGMPSIN